MNTQWGEGDRAGGRARLHIGEGQEEVISLYLTDQPRGGSLKKPTNHHARMLLRTDCNLTVICLLPREDT